MKAEEFVKALECDYFVGVPDSQLKELCNYLVMEKEMGKEHMIAANEGNCVGLAAGYYLATGKIPVVYMQNSGLGNIINPAASLLHPKVYGIPCVFIVGWRGEPGVHDEPQHIFQGEVTETLLKDLEMQYQIVDKDTETAEIKETMQRFRTRLQQGESVAFLVRKGAFVSESKVSYKNSNKLTREAVIEEIVKAAGEGIVVSTTGKASRELFEIRERLRQGHEKDFLTVGSMGHASSIALEIALRKTAERVWCIDGDGAALMHMGAMAVIGSRKPENLVHILINNEAHETVGGMPTVADSVDFLKIAEGCGYQKTYRVQDEKELALALTMVGSEKELTFLEIKCNLFSRKDLGRPTTTAKENKENFMRYLIGENKETAL